MHPTLRRITFGLTLGLVLTHVPDMAHADPATEDASLRNSEIPGLIAASVAGTLRNRHYAEQPINDEVSRDWFDGYLNDLDPQHLYFLQSDIDALQPFRELLDNDLESETPLLQLGWAAGDIYRTRVAQRVERALAILEGDPTQHEGQEIYLDRSDSPWPTTLEEADELWARRIHDDVIRQQLTSPDTELAVIKERLTKRYTRMGRNVADLEDLDLLELFLSSLTEYFDPHTVWFKPISRDNFNIRMNDALEGIGAELRVEEGYTTITRLIPGGPAELSEAIRPGDRIIAVAQEGESAVDVVEERLDSVVQLIRGPKGTTVILTIERTEDGPTEVLEVRLTRDRVVLEASSASSSIREIDGKTIGIIDIPSFYADTDARDAGVTDYRSTTHDVEAILGEFNKQGVDAVVLDLRTNGGGMLDQALGTTGLFLPGGPVVQVRDRAGRVEVLDDPSPRIAWSKPVVVLTSEMSASASEILAGALKDHGRALIVGADTHGKGTVQNFIDLSRRLLRKQGREGAELAGALKFTTHMFYRVNGASTQLKGVTPDIAIPSPFAGLPYREEDLDHALDWHEISPARYRAETLDVSLAELTRRSAERVSQELEFGFLSEDLGERERREALETLPLNLKERKAELDLADAAAEARRKVRMAHYGWDDDDEDAEPPDVILNEAAAIARDMLE
ncbi:MAG: carboxy terminal-processing peptidase [Myxococcota bacterium]